jgi:prepilin-type N-terminal cleavage/methylation domain-containing protein
MTPATKKGEGFTLIELIIVVIVIGIMGAALVPVMVASLGAYNATRDDVVVLDKQRYAIERLAREIREVNFTNSTFAFNVANANAMTFTRQFIYDVSGVASSATATVAVGNTGATTGTVTLAYDNGSANILTDQLDGLTGLSFSYLNQGGSSVAYTSPDLRAIDITLRLRHNNQPYTQTTRVELKNYAKP